MTLQKNVKEAIEHGRSVIKKYEDNGLNETTTRYAIIDPILRALGWKLDDPDQCWFEEWRSRKKQENYGKTDYSLYKGQTLVAFVEAKPLTNPLSGFYEENQLRSYRSRPRVRVLTNGRFWYFYFSAKDFGKDRCPDVDIKAEGAANILINNLSRYKHW